MNIRDHLIRKLGGKTEAEHAHALEEQRVGFKNFIEQTIVPYLDQRRVIPLTSCQRMVAGSGWAKNLQGDVLVLGDNVQVIGVNLNGTIHIAPWAHRGYISAVSAVKIHPFPYGEVVVEGMTNLEGNLGGYGEPNWEHAP